jgi:UDP-N-acetylmuramate--alanine ligase
MEKCHFIGIGGIGMSGLARIMLGHNIPITGSDIATSYVTEGLEKAGAKVFIGHSAEYIAPNTTVVYGSDIKESNPEYQAALTLKCPILHRSELLAFLMKDYKTLSVTGTHGKTTTSALLTYVLTYADLDPAFAVGGVIQQLQANAGHGEGDYFVAEADESDGTFLNYHSFGAIITNINLDHMNHFITEERLLQSFQQFASQVASSEHLFWCGDNVRLKSLSLPGISYGVGEDCMLRAQNIRQEGWKNVFDVTFKGKSYSQVEVALIGHHNVLNALAVFGLALTLGIDEGILRRALAFFEGTKRRCDKKGEVQGVLVLDDYAHHPTEIMTTLKGIRKSIKEKRLIAVFQPHRYTRTKDCLGTYAGIFESADELVITDLFGAGETPIAGVTHEPVLAEIQVATRIPCRYVPRQSLTQFLATFVRPHDVVVTLGAGDVTKVGAELVEKLKVSSVQKLRLGICYGGLSSEHEISLRSVRNIYNELHRDYYDLQHFGITQRGEWLSGPSAMYQLEALLKDQEAFKTDSLLPPHALAELLQCDILFPVLHGSNGEDGTIQGLFEMLGKAYVGCDHRSAAVCMDKALTKTLVLAEGIATSPFIKVSQYEWTTHEESLQRHICEMLTFPVYVKPVHLGSSVGVYKVDTESQLKAAIEKALRVDTDLIVENGIKGRELEFAVFGNDEITAFPPGEIHSAGQVYDYEGKYGAQGMQTSIQAVLTLAQKEEGMALAKRAYQAAGCVGFARVDFFFDENNKYWLNEINPIPGFTSISLYPQMCEANGLSTQDLLDRLIILALQRKRQRANLKHER